MGQPVRDWQKMEAAPDVIRKYSEWIMQQPQLLDDLQAERQDTRMLVRPKHATDVLARLANER